MHFSHFCTCCEKWACFTWKARYFCKIINCIYQSWDFMVGNKKPWMSVKQKFWSCLYFIIILAAMHFEILLNLDPHYPHPTQLQFTKSPKVGYQTYEKVLFLIYFINAQWARGWTKIKEWKDSNKSFIGGIWYHMPHRVRKSHSTLSQKLLFIN